MIEKSIVKKARKLTKKAQDAVAAYKQNPNCEDTRKDAKAAKVKAEKYIHFHFPETHSMYETVGQIHDQYHEIKDGPYHYYLTASP
tara:strand:- start:280 stop:537 length:258 start_codon:yes stop_codon:yes gene_type:complete